MPARFGKEIKMDITTRNHIFMDNIDLINRTLRRHRLTLYVLHIEPDDVYQELAIAALQAIDSYDDRRCDSVAVHIWLNLQNAILSIKRRNMPLGRAAYKNSVPGDLPLELYEDDDIAIADETGIDNDVVREKRLRQALGRLEPQERRAVLDYLDGMKPARAAEKICFDMALKKLRAYYFDAYMAAQLGL